MNVTLSNNLEFWIEPRAKLILGEAPDGTPRTLALTQSGSLHVSGAPGMTPIIAAGVTTPVEAEFTRPADTTQYAIGDAVCNSTAAPSMITFPNVARIAGGTGIILSGRLTTNKADVVNASFRLWLFNEPVAATNDNAPLPLLYANTSKRLGFIEFTLGLAGAGGDCAFGQATSLNLDYAAAAGSRDLYGILEARAAYTPASGQKFTLKLGVAND